MLDYMIWVWLVLFVLAVILEFATLDFVGIWFAIAAIPSFILALFGVHPVIQFVVFALITVVLLFLTRPVVVKYFKTNEIKTNVDSIVGTVGIVTKEITPLTIGTVKMPNVEWSAISKDAIEVGAHVRVLDVEGVKLIVEKI
jgi:membrane protein implicated in regulation of membrane protease activity